MAVNIQEVVYQSKGTRCDLQLPIAPFEPQESLLRPVVVFAMT